MFNSMHVLIKIFESSGMWRYVAGRVLCILSSIKAALFGLPGPENGGSKILRNFGEYLPSDTVWHHRRLETSATPLCENLKPHFMTSLWVRICWQCDGKNGVCPDERIGGRNDAVLVSGERKNGVTTIAYRRPLQTNEPINDRAVPTDVEVSVIAAIGPLNSRKEANIHAARDKTTGEWGLCVTVSYRKESFACDVIKMSSRLPYENVKVKMYRTTILPVVLYVCET